MDRNRIAFFASLAALSAAMIIWGDLFRWSKVVQLPEWASALPSPLMLPSYLAFVCLLPAALGTNSFATARAAVLKSVLVAPITTVIAFALNPLNRDASLLINVPFHYAWIVLFFCALPAALVVVIRAGIDFVVKQKHS
ncbi:MAG: hypothetical protein QM803_18850 [Rhodocyclaceae bacterium]